MSQSAPPSDYLLLSRGQWDRGASPKQIQTVIDRFYAWYDRLVSEGRIGRPRAFPVMEKRGSLIRTQTPRTLPRSRNG